MAFAHADILEDFTFMDPDGCTPDKKLINPKFNATSESSTLHAGFGGVV